MLTHRLGDPLECSVIQPTGQVCEGVDGRATRALAHSGAAARDDAELVVLASWAGAGNDLVSGHSSLAMHGRDSSTAP